MTSCSHVSFTCSNRNAILKYYRNSLRGTVYDFIITFHNEESDLELIIQIASDLFEKLCQSFDGELMKSDLIAKVKYLRTSTGKPEIYYHSSSPSDYVINPLEFFRQHMLRIGSRIDKMNERGSMLIIISIEEVHIRLSLVT